MSMGDGNATHLGRGVESRGEAGRRRGGKKEDNERERRERGREEREEVSGAIAGVGVSALPIPREEPASAALPQLASLRLTSSASHCNCICCLTLKHHQTQFADRAMREKRGAGPRTVWISLAHQRMMEAME